MGRPSRPGACALGRMVVQRIRQRLAYDTVSAANVRAMKSIETVPDDMQRCSEQCRAKCDAIVEQFRSSIERLPSPDTIYHYTDSVGLLGILQSRTIRLTDMFGLNDPSELRHAVNHAKAVLAEGATRGHPAATLFARQFNAIITGAPEGVADFFVACFSANGDELGQWRAYADDGHGFALAFDRDLIERAFVMPDGAAIERNSTFPITYDDAALRTLQHQLVSAIIPLISMPHGRKLQNATINEFLKGLSMHLGLCVLNSALYFKHEAYSAEREYRFLQIRPIHADLSDLKQRARRTSLVRFTEFAMDPRAVREIIIGPAADEGAARSFVANCMSAGGFESDEIRIVRSRIPYRTP